MKRANGTCASAANLLAFTLLLPFASAAKHEKILLSNVQTLTLRSSLKTTHRRVPPIPQLKCTGGGACHLYEPSTIRCQNAGHDYSPESIQWTCTASLPPEFKLGSTDVVCEGFNSPDDQYILRGSCGVEYRLLLTEAGEGKYGRPDASWYDSGRSSLGDNWETSSSKGNGSKAAQLLFFAVFLGVLFLILRAMYLQYAGRLPPQRASRNPRRPDYGSGWQGGGNGGDDDDPPPPYDWRSKSSSSHSPYRAPRQEGWRPGFWSGLGTGAAAGYAARSMANQGRERQGGTRSGVAGNYGASPSNARDASGSRSESTSTYSSTRYESSGFGGTSRR